MANIAVEFLAAANFQQAWLKVKENNGCAGADGETIEDFGRDRQRNLDHLRKIISKNNYQPHPLKQVLIPKDNGKTRELRIPTVRDRIVQQALLNVLVAQVEPIFSPCSFAYRPNLSIVKAVEKIADWRDLGYHWIVDADIVQYFDSIDHQILLRELREHIDHPGILCLIKAWISSGIQVNGQIITQVKGIPQGAVISPLLANVYLDKFDRAILSTDLKLVRYADDFLVLARSRDRIIQAYSEVVRLLHSLNLAIHPDKTQITNFERGFTFLGHGFLGDAIFPVDKPKQKSQSLTNPKKKLDLLSIAEIEANSNTLPLILPSLLVESISENNNTKTIPKNIWNQSMGTLYLLEQGTSLFKDNLRFIIYVPQKNKLEVPIREVEKIFLFGNINLSTPAIAVCLESQINVLFLSPSGRYKGHLANTEASNLNIQLLQYQYHSNVEFKLDISKAIVLGKLINSKQLLLRLYNRRKNSLVQDAIIGISNDIELLKSTNNIDSLRGYEGISSARYFPAFGELITNSDFEFSQRHRQPPTDPVNALLSFGYTLLFNNVLSIIIAEGLSPYFGNFHYGEKKKAYLAFDLMEEFRSPIVDSLVITLINQHIFNADDFERKEEDRGIYLVDRSRRIFLDRFEARMSELTFYSANQPRISYREVIQLQVQLYKRSLVTSTIYEPFIRAK
jgi:CRISPR-associated protein Cas1